MKGTILEIKLPIDCGNAPRIRIVGEFTVSWAKTDTDVVSEWLADDARWTFVGGDTHVGPKAAEELQPRFSPERLEIISIITHGRLASCDGFLEAAGRRLNFSHSIRFASTSKTARIAELRSYCIESQYDARARGRDR